MSKLRRISIAAVVLLLASLCVSNVAFATNYWYVGTQKCGSFYGVSANITAPSVISKLGSSDAIYAWVSNVQGSGTRTNWIQTGFFVNKSRPTLYQTYVETMYNQTRIFTTIGIHLFGATISYKVERLSDGKWHAYIAGYDKGSLSMPSCNVQAYVETHASNSTLRAFKFSSVKYKTSTTWHSMDAAVTADTPYAVTVTNSANFATK